MLILDGDCSQNVSNPDQAPATVLNIVLLGSPEVSFQEKLLKFRSRKILALLLYLAVAGGSHRREKLVALFWPESGPRQGNATLRSSLARIKKTLAIAGTFILAESGNLRFDDSQAYRLDLHQLDAIWRNGSIGQLEAFFGKNHGEFMGRFFHPRCPGV